MLRHRCSLICKHSERCCNIHCLNSVSLYQLNCVQTKSWSPSPLVRFAFIKPILFYKHTHTHRQMSASDYAFVKLFIFGSQRMNVLKMLKPFLSKMSGLHLGLIIQTVRLCLDSVSVVTEVPKCISALCNLLGSCTGLCVWVWAATELSYIVQLLLFN